MQPLRVQARVGRDLVVAAAPRVQARAGGPDPLGEHALDRHVHVLVGDPPLELAGLDLAVDLREPRLDRVRVCLGDDALRGEHARVRDGAADVLGPHALVDRQRGAELGQEPARRLSNRPPQGVLASVTIGLLRGSSCRWQCLRIGGDRLMRVVGRRSAPASCQACSRARTPAGSGRRAPARCRR